jgi:hypothetical protein
MEQKEDGLQMRKQKKNSQSTDVAALKGRPNSSQNCDSIEKELLYFFIIKLIEIESTHFKKNPANVENGK